jgi:hypothetical protein
MKEADRNSAMMRAWTIMNNHMGIEYDESGKLFKKWSSEGEFVGCLRRFAPALTDSKTRSRYIRTERPEQVGSRRKFNL